MCADKIPVWWAEGKGEEVQQSADHKSSTSTLLRQQKKNEITITKNHY